MKGNKPIINIIVKNKYGETINVESITNTSKLKTTEDAGNYIMKKMKWPVCFDCGYDKAIQQRLLVRDAESKQGSIDWLLRTDDFSISEALAASFNNSVTLIVICYEQFPELGCLDDAFSLLEYFLKLVFVIVSLLYNYFSPYKQLMKEYKVDKSFINDTIKLRRHWDKGFISSRKIRFKGVIERSIMKKLGYRIINGRWTVKNDIDIRFKFPYEIMRGE